MPNPPAPSQTQSPDPIWVGWAGYLFQTPRQFRLARVEGDYLRGGLALADDQSIRLELQWLYQPNPNFDIQTHVRKKLSSDAQRFHSPLGDLWFVQAEDKKPARIAGYSPATRRFLEIHLHPSPESSAAQDEDFLKSLANDLTDQPPAAPMNWSFFDCSFITPANFLYADSTLNLGDMSVRLMTSTSEKAGQVLTIRQIYPATLALARQPLDAWLREWDKNASTRYVREGTGVFGRKPALVRTCQTPLGEGCSTRSTLRRGMSLLYWKMPKAAEAQIVEDKTTNRLIGVRVSGPPDQNSKLINSILSHGLHWAR